MIRRCPLSHTIIVITRSMQTPSYRMAIHTNMIATQRRHMDHLAIIIIPSLVRHNLIHNIAFVSNKAAAIHIDGNDTGDVVVASVDGIAGEEMRRHSIQQQDPQLSLLLLPLILQMWHHIVFLHHTFGTPRVSHSSNHRLAALHMIHYTMVVE